MSSKARGTWLVRLGIFAAGRWGVKPHRVNAVERVKACKTMFIRWGPRGEGEQTVGQVHLEPFSWGGPREAVEMRVGWHEESGTLLFCVMSVRPGQGE